MKLGDLIEVLEEKRTYGPPAERIDIERITTNSQSVRHGDLFVALRGSTADGHEYVVDAVQSGATAVVTEEYMAEALPEGVSSVVVDDTAKALARLAARYYGDPADHLFLCGITGTNGKTSTAHMYRSIIEASGWGRMGILGTLGHGAGGDLLKTPHTTPAPVELHALLRKMVDEGCDGVVMEVSSHAVRQHRTWGLDFNVGILTNVTHDHLDYHKTIEDYRAAKKEFCDSLTDPRRRKPLGSLVYCHDDPVARRIGEQFRGRKLPVIVGGDGGGGEGSAVSVAAVEATLEGTSFTLQFHDADDIRVNMRLLGSFCAVNAALAAGGARVTGISVAAIKEGLEAVEGVPGRFEAIGGGGRPIVIIDYSHTPDSMERVLTTCRGLGPGRVVTVFGCGGDRDATKRPLMGRVAQSFSDFVYVTMDNPRTESVESIVEDILSGMDRRQDDFTVELDRGRAILAAVGEAAADDVVVLLGKGVENCQIVGSERIPFSDRGEAEGALKKWRSR
jgi:UDP-N-acetylmuramoyl-L-alanyl-D-glutamate--2,6-diaminopimelate ligase